MLRSRDDGRAAAGERRSASRAGRLPATAGWLVVTPLALSAGARVAHLDESSSALLLADGLTPLLGPPALVALGIGLRRRRRLLTVVSAATAGVYLWSALSGLGVPAEAQPPAGTVPTLRLFSANVYDANPDIGWVAAEIRASAPDLLALQEVGPGGAAGLRRAGILARFPYAVTAIRTGASGVALWSRFPLVNTSVEDVRGVPFIRATVVFGARRLRLYTIHTVAPLGADRVRWRA